MVGGVLPDSDSGQTLRDKCLAVVIIVCALNYSYAYPVLPEIYAVI